MHCGADLFGRLADTERLITLVVLSLYKFVAIFMLEVHGRFSMIPNGQILYARPYDSWNIECAETYVAAFAETLQYISQQGKHYFLFIDLRYWGLGTQDSMRKLNETQRIRAVLKMIKLGQIYFGAKSLPISVSEKMFRSNETNHYRVETADTAIALLQQLGVAFNEAELSKTLVTKQLPFHPLSPI